MMLPPLVHYKTPREYREHYERVYCRGKIVTFDGIRVYFKPTKFGHAFYESTDRSGRKDVFCPVRSKRIDWIKATLEHPDAKLVKGWNKEDGCYEPARRVAVVFAEFVVVVEMSLTTEQIMKANFVTCYQADRSIDQIRSAPAWAKEECMELLTKNKGR